VTAALNRDRVISRLARRWYRRQFPVAIPSVFVPGAECITGPRYSYLFLYHLEAREAYEKKHAQRRGEAGQ